MCSRWGCLGGEPDRCHWRAAASGSWYAETLMPSFASSPRIRMHPHRGFSPPIRRMRSRTVLGDRWSASRRSPTEGPLPPHQLPVPPKERLGADQERRPPSSRKDPAHRGHEHPVMAAKARAAHLALEDLQLVTKDHELDFGIQLFDG